MNDLLAWLVPLTTMGLMGAVIWTVKIAMDYASLKKDVENVQVDMDRIGKLVADHAEWDRASHKELFDSRNLDAVTLERLKTLFEGMDRKLDEILERERARNGSH